MSGIVHLDISELIAAPLRSGIQRIEREAITHWPGPARLIPCMVDAAGRWQRLPFRAFEILCGADDGTSAARAAAVQGLAGCVASAEPVRPGEMTHLLNIELFYGPARAAAHLDAAAAGVRVLWYLYDFLPFLRPELFPPGTTRHCMHFLRGLRAAAGLAFLSAETRRDYAERIARTPPAEELGPVISPGADGLRLESQTFRNDRHDFVAIGTVEPRKNADAMLAAFERLWAGGSNARLVVAGRISPEATQARSFFERHAGNPLLVVLDQPDDETLRRVLRSARAVVMPSEAEGFGLPPYEAKHAGIPAIASARLPSAAMLPRGAMLLERMDAASIAAAVTALTDDAQAAKLWEEARGVSLPTWADFGRELGAWAQVAANAR